MSTSRVVVFLFICYAMQEKDWVVVFSYGALFTAFGRLELEAGAGML